MAHGKARRTLVVVVVLAMAGVLWLRHRETSDPPARQMAAPGAGQPAISPAAIRLETRDYIIYSTATDGQTAQVASAVESLHKAYSGIFRSASGASGTPAKLQLVLYRNRQEFKANNRSTAWAEAYYLPPRCHAYFAENDPNPYHWMIHEATHQLNREVAHLPKARWTDEGLATYFGASKIEGGNLVPGKIDPDAYPVWWLSDLTLSGDLQADIANGKIIPLRAIVSGQGGPNIDNTVNLYYIEYWSLTHFLFHYREGKHSRGYRQLIARGGSLKDFETFVGPIDQIQQEWYGYLQRLAATTPPRTKARNRSPDISDTGDRFQIRPVNPPLPPSP